MKPGGAPTTGDSYAPAISSDGRYVAFHSAAHDLVSGDDNGYLDVFVFDRNTDTTERISKSANGEPENGDSTDAAISADGRYVAFASMASNLIANDTNGASDIFVYDRQTQQTQRVSVNWNGSQPDGPSFSPDISADGRYVVYASDAASLAAGDGNNRRDIFLYDRTAGATKRLSVDANGYEANGDSDNPAISPDGGHVAYESAATNLVAGDTNGVTDIFVIDLVYYNPPTPTPTATPTFVTPTLAPTATKTPTPTNTPTVTPTPTITPTPTPLPGPDLVVESVSFYPWSHYEPDENGIVTIITSARIRNNGNRVVPLTMYDYAIKVSFYIDREPTCADDGDIVYWYVRPDGWSRQLNPGAYFDVPQQTKLVDREYGTHTVNVSVDPCNRIAEQRENNNTNAGTYDIIRADYVIDQLSVEPLVPQVNQPVTFTIVTRNAGTKIPPNDQTAALGVWVYDIGEGSDPALEACPGQPVTTGGHGNSWAPIRLGPGEVYTATYTYVYTQTHTLWARAFMDYRCEVDEINDYNNYSNYGSGPLIFHVEQHLPDLVVDSIVPVPAQPPLNSPFQYRVTVHNAGQGASAWSTLSIFPGSVPAVYPDYCDVTTGRLAFGQVPALAAGASTVLTLTVPALTDANAHLVYALADWTCDRAEDSDNNNHTSTAVYAAAPDLEVASITWEPDPLYPGQEPTYHVVVSNTGALASGPVNLRLYADSSPSGCNPGGYLATIGVPGLAVGQATTINVGGATFATAGGHTIYAYVDAACQAIEEDETNNINSTYLFVSPTVLSESASHKPERCAGPAVRQGVVHLLRYGRKRRRRTGRLQPPGSAPRH